MSAKAHFSSKQSIWLKFSFHKLHILSFFYTFAVAMLFKSIATGCSAVRLAHLLWEQGVEGSNPFTPTKETNIVANSMADMPELATFYF